MRFLLPVSLLLSIVATVFVNAQERPGDPLLDDLKSTPTKNKAAAPTAASLTERLRQELTGGEDIGEEEQQPLQRVRRRMQLAEELIAAKAISQETQELQKLISDELAAMVSQAQKQGQGGSARRPQTGQQSQAANPMGEGTGEAKAGPPRDSSQRLDSGEVASSKSAADSRAVMQRLWGNLPEKVREQMQSAPIEQFLPKYNKLIQEYYKRLAEEPR
jgi:hypothetical protein